MVSKAEAEFFKIVEAEKKALEEAESKRNAAFAEVKQAIAQEGVTHEEYQEGESESAKQSEEVRRCFRKFDSLTEFGLLVCNFTNHVPPAETCEFCGFP